MNLYEGIFTKLSENEKINNVFSESNINIIQEVELKCYEALQKIKAVIEDDSLEDRECFIKIEGIICALEDLGSGGGNRHNFG